MMTLWTSRCLQVRTGPKILNHACRGRYFAIRTIATTMTSSNKKSVSSAPPIVSTTWLHNRLTSGHSEDALLVLDSSWTPDKNDPGRDQYLEKHIPGAIFYDMDVLQENPTTLIPRSFPSTTVFTNLAQSLGVHPHSHVIVYDRGDIYCAARTWWTFRAFGHQHVSMLDGGLLKWTTDGYETTSGDEPSKEKGTFVGELQRNLFATYDDIAEMLETKTGNLVDVRFSKHYQGKSKEPAQFTRISLASAGLQPPMRMHRGHIRGAVNIPFMDVFDQEKLQEYWVFAEKDKLKKLFQEKKIDLEKPLTTMCYVGNTSNIISLAAAVVGKDDVKNYYGSWTEWAQKAPLETIEGPGTEQSNL